MKSMTNMENIFAKTSSLWKNFLKDAWEYIYWLITAEALSETLLIWIILENPSWFDFTWL